MAKRSTDNPTSPADVTDQVRLCVIFGSEEMLKYEHLETLRKVMRQTHGDFDTVYFDGESASLADVLDEVRTFSLLQSFKFVVVDEADKFVKREGHREALHRYAQNPVEQAVLVLRSSLWNKGKLDDAIQAVGFIARCDPLSANEVKTWLVRRAKAVHQCVLSSDLAGVMVERLGTNLMRLDSELAKLALGGDKGASITLAMIEELTGRSSEEKAFAIQQVILQAMLGQTQGQKPGRMMLETLHELVDLARNDEVPVQFAVTDLMRKICFATILRAKKVGDGAIASRLKLWGPAKDGVLTLSQRIKPIDARRWYDRMMDDMLSERQGVGDPLRHLETFCAQLAEEVAVGR